MTGLHDTVARVARAFPACQARQRRGHHRDKLALLPSSNDQGHRKTLPHRRLALGTERLGGTAGKYCSKHGSKRSEYTRESVATGQLPVYGL